MIETISDFIKEHPRAVIVNYDIAKKLDYGVTYRTSTGSLEKFRKVNEEYIKFPYIQPYLKLTNSNYELFIIYQKKMYKLALSNDTTNYKIDKEVLNVSKGIYNDRVFNDMTNLKTPVIVNEKIKLIKKY